MILCKYEEVNYERDVTDFVEINSSRYETFKVISIITRERMYVIFYTVDMSEYNEYKFKHGI
jgi:hypothetical protein